MLDSPMTIWIGFNAVVVLLLVTDLLLFHRQPRESLAGLEAGFAHCRDDTINLLLRKFLVAKKSGARLGNERTDLLDGLEVLIHERGHIASTNSLTPTHTLTRLPRRE